MVRGLDGCYAARIYTDFFFAALTSVLYHKKNVSLNFHFLAMRASILMKVLIINGCLDYYLIMKLLHKELSDQIIKTFYDVYNELGFGFQEKVYQNALYIELKSRGFRVEAQKQIKVYFKDCLVGEYFADLMINDTIILELKAVEFILEVHEAQLFSYLKATSVELGFLLNFGKRPEFRRKVFENNRK